MADDDLIFRHDAIEQPGNRASMLAEIHELAELKSPAFLDDKSDAFVFGFLSELKRRRAAAAEVATTPLPPRRKTAPLPNSLASQLTEDERALPRWKQPLDGELKRRRDSMLANKKGQS
jgi:hypothetical protein